MSQCVFTTLGRLEQGVPQGRHAAHTQVRWMRNEHYSAFGAKGKAYKTVTRLLLTDCGPSTEADDNTANHLMGRQRGLKVLVGLILEELKGLYHNNTAKASPTAKRGQIAPGRPKRYAPMGPASPQVPKRTKQSRKCSNWLDLKVNGSPAGSRMLYASQQQPSLYRHRGQRQLAPLSDAWHRFGRALGHCRGGSPQPPPAPPLP